MSYNKQYNTRRSSGYNTPGQFVPAGEQLPQQTYAGANPPAPLPQRKPQQQHAAQQNSAQQQINQNLQNIQISGSDRGSLQTADVEMRAPMPPSDSNNSTPAEKPHWMKSKLPGVKKVSNKERRRRQNENLRRLLTPKNALMVLNEMLPDQQLTNQFNVQQSTQFNPQYYNNKQQHSFTADLTINGNVYKGYGENKLTARNVAAEQAIRDLIIKKMNKVLGSESMGTEGESAEEALPMIQLASFALHKLFTEWEYDGHKVPQLKPQSVSVSETGSESGMSTASAKARGTKKRELPSGAASMHPCMLLTYMRPQLEYRELSVDGDRPQNMVFTMGVDVDGSTYIGKAPNKKEARKQAARAACTALFGVQFDDTHTSNNTTPAPMAVQ